MYLTKIKIIEDFRCLIKDTEITPRSLTLLVGEQGCGKSSLLELLQRNEIKVELSELGKKGVNSYYFDTEKMNPRLQNIDAFSNPDGTNKGIGVGGGIVSRFKSHGEVLRGYTVDRIKDAKDCVLLLDEPESALSLKNQYKLAKELKKAIKRNVQIVIATHCLPIIESIEEVYSMETLEWVSSKEFIKNSK